MVAPLLSEAVSRNGFAAAVSSTSQHVALAGSVALRWERGIRHRAAAHARPGEHQESTKRSWTKHPTMGTARVVGVREPRAAVAVAGRGRKS